MATSIFLGWSTTQHGSSTADLSFAQQPETGHTAVPSPPSTADDRELSPITIDYPENESIFPPEITPPTFLWRDTSNNTSVWTINVMFSDGSAGIHAKSAGEPLLIGEIDPRCISASNELPKLTPQQAAARTWIPDATTWEAMKQHSKEHPATITITGFRDELLHRPISRGRLTIKTSMDPVGAPIFYRDVPLIPSELEEGVIKPLAPKGSALARMAPAQHRRAQQPIATDRTSHVRQLPLFFLATARHLGMDLDGPANDKGLYMLAPVQPQMAIGNQDVISWSSIRGK